ncbi:MAG: hypothetical protein IJ622_05115 [Bacteroidales bacterium]|nr:hypothetical protein [Bacteroidales bacterium]
MLIPFALGIWCCVCLPWDLPPLIQGVAGLLIFVFAIISSSTLERQRQSWLFGVMMSCYFW